VAERKPFLLRLDPETFAALQSWAADDLRSVNGQVEFLLRRALRDAGRLPGRGGAAPGATRGGGSSAAAGGDTSGRTRGREAGPGGHS
jgi:hypothetical protein